MVRSFEELLKEQSSIGEEFSNVLATFPKGIMTRQALSGVMKILGTADKEWLKFLENDDALSRNRDMPSGHEYFVNGYKNTVKVFVSKISAAVNEAVHNFTGINPEYDLVNRGAIDRDRMFDDSGKDLRPNAEENKDLVTIPSVNEKKDLKSGSYERPTEKIVEPIVRDFFEHVSNKSMNRSENDNGMFNSTAGMEKATKMLDDAIVDYNQAFQDKSDDKTLRHLGIMIIEKWNMAGILHEGLAQRDLDRYDPRIYYECADRTHGLVEHLKEMYVSVNRKKDSDDTKRQKSIKMPQIEIPKFDGDYGKWTIFKDLFRQMIDQRDLTDAERFMYLRGNLSGEPHDMIKSLQVTAENYALAWELLNERYENPRHIIKSMLNKLLFNTERAKQNNSASLKRIYDAFRESMYAVKIAAQTDEKLLDMIFHQLLLNRMDTITLSLYEQTLDNEKQPTSVAVLVKFVAKRFRALEYSVDDSSSKAATQHTGNKQHRQQTTALTVATTNSESKVKICACKEKHSITKCPKFTKLSIGERFKLAKRAAVCLKCLKPGHVYKTCSGKPCFTCNRNHHTLLHFVKQLASLHLGSTIQNAGIDHVFLGTAIIHVMSAQGFPIKMRALLDSGAQLNVMSEKMLHKTGLNCTPANMEIKGFT